MLAINVNAGIELAIDRFKEAEPDLVEAIVEGVGQFAAGEFTSEPEGDLEGATLANGVVSLPNGFNEAYESY